MDNVTQEQQPTKPFLTKETYTQSEVNRIASDYRNSLTTRNGREKRYSRAELQSILDAIEANPKHRE